MKCALSEIHCRLCPQAHQCEIYKVFEELSELFLEFVEEASDYE